MFLGSRLFEARVRLAPENATYVQAVGSLDEEKVDIMS